MNILLVEDDVVDVMAIQRLFDRVGLQHRLFVARDGVEALEKLKGTGEMSAVPKPRLILLDLKMPRMGGIEFLRELRVDDDPDLRDLPVIVLTRSDLASDRRETRELEVAGYFIKDTEVEPFVRVLAELTSDPPAAGPEDSE